MVPRIPSLFFLLALAVPLGAQESPRLGLPQVLASVRRQDPQVAAAQADARMAQGMELAAYAWMPPQLQWGVMGLAWPNPSLSQNQGQSLSLIQELPFPGRTFLAGRVASHQARQREAQAQVMIGDELVQAEQAFWALVAAQWLLRALDRVSEATHEMAGLSRKRAGFGQLDRMGQFMDAMLGMEDSDVESMKPMALQQKHMAQAALNRLMGADPVTPLPDADLDTQALLDAPAPELEQSLRQAEARYPGLEAVKQALSAAEAAHAQTLGGWLPDLMLQGTVSDDGMGGRQSSALLGASLPWIWGWKQAGESAAAGAARDQAQAGLSAGRLALRQQVRDAVGEVQADQAALRITLEHTLPQAEEGLKQARAGFRTTALGSSEILMAVQDYRMTQEKAAQLISALGAARAMLTQLSGGPAAFGGKP